MPQSTVAEFNGTNFDILRKVAQKLFYEFSVTSFAPFSLVGALVDRFVLRGWFVDQELHYANRAQEVIEAIKSHVPPCVLMAYYKSLFNGWATSARTMQHCEKVCLLCSDCDGHDRIEHYAVCDFHWGVFVRRFKRPVVRNCMENFFGLVSDNLEDVILRVVHVYAVMMAYNNRKHAQRITGPEEIDSLIWNGHSVAQLYHAGLRKRYSELWKTRYSVASSSSSSSSSYSSSTSSTSP